MSDPTRELTTWQQVQARFQTAIEERLHYVLLLIIAGLLVSSTGSWFLGHVALASVIAVPTVKWFFGKNERSPKRWIRISLAVGTLTVFIWGGIADGFENGALYACLIFLITGFGWVKREKMLAFLIFLSFVVLSEFGNVACFTAAIVVTAGMLHKQWKLDAANKKARLADLFEERDLSQRPTHLGTTGGGFRDWERFDDRPTTGYPGNDHPTGPVRVPQDLGDDQRPFVEENPHGQTGTFPVTAQDGPPRRFVQQPPIKEGDGQQG